MPRLFLSDLPPIEEFEADMDSALPSKPYMQPCSLKQPLVLAVEDDDDNLLLIGYVLEAFGYRFMGQTDSQTALTLVKEHQPDLILLDILLPNVDGIKFVQQLKQDSMTCEIPVIAVTALARSEDRENILLSGFTDYISKPYMLDDLEALIHRHLG